MHPQCEQILLLDSWQTELPYSFTSYRTLNSFAWSSLKRDFQMLFRIHFPEGNWYVELKTCASANRFHRLITRWIKTISTSRMFIYDKVKSSYQASLHLERLDLDSLHSFIQKLLLFILRRLLRGRLRQEENRNTARFESLLHLRHVCQTHIRPGV